MSRNNISGSGNPYQAQSYVNKETYDRSSTLLYVNPNGTPSVPLTSSERQIVQLIKHANDKNQRGPNPYYSPEIDYSVKANVVMDAISKKYGK